MKLRQFDFCYLNKIQYYNYSVRFISSPTTLRCYETSLSSTLCQWFMEKLMNRKIPHYIVDLDTFYNWYLKPLENLNICYHFNRCVKFIYAYVVHWTLKCYHFPFWLLFEYFAGFHMQCAILNIFFSAFLGEWRRMRSESDIIQSLINTSANYLGFDSCCVDKNTLKLINEMNWMACTSKPYFHCLVNKCIDFVDRNDKNWNFRMSIFQWKWKMHQGNS